LEISPSCEERSSLATPHFMGHEDTYRADQQARHFPEPGQTVIRSYLVSKRHISILFSHLCLGLMSGL